MSKLWKYTKREFLWTIKEYFSPITYWWNMKDTNKSGFIMILVAIVVLIVGLNYAAGDDFKHSSERWGYVEKVPEYSWGKWNNEGNLSIVLGGVDNNDVYDLEASWKKNFVARSNCVAILEIKYKLTQAANYENDEYSTAFLHLQNGKRSAKVVLSKIVGDGNDGYDQTTGWVTQRVRFNLVPGTNVVSFGAFNNKKTWNDEITVLLVDYVNVTFVCPDNRYRSYNKY